MIFDRWHYLLGVLSVPLILGAGWWAVRRTETVLNFLSPSSRFDRLFVLSALLLEAAGFGLLFCALAGPERLETPSETARKPLDVVVAVDTSLSMRAEDVAPNRIGRARREVRALIDRLVERDRCAASDRSGSSRLGLVEFARTARIVSPLTRDFQIFDGILPAVDGRNMETVGSDLAAGMSAGLRLFDDSPAARNLIVVTDGEHRAGDSEFEALGDEARDRKVSVYALVVGTPEGARIPLGLEQGFLTDGAGQEVLTRGRVDLIGPFVRSLGAVCVASADRAFPMDALFEELAGRARLEVSSPDDRSDRSLFQWFLLAGLLCFLAGIGLDLRRPFAKGASVSIRPAAAIVTAAAIGLLFLSCGTREGADLVRKGNRFFQVGDFARAATSFDGALTFLPDHGGIKLNLGLARYRQGRYGEASLSLERAAESTDRQVSLPARFGLGLCDYKIALEALEKVDSDQARLELARRAAHRGIGIFDALAEEGFRKTETEQNRDILQDIADRIGRRLAEEAEPSDNMDSADRSTGDPAAEGAPLSEEEASGGLTASEARQPPPEGSARVIGWADDPGTLSPAEISRIYARLEELKKARQSRDAQKARERLAGEVDW